MSATTELASISALALLPVPLGLIASRLSRRAARHVSPAGATLLLTATALTVALTTGLLLCLAAYVGTVELLPGIHPDDWSAEILRRRLPIPLPAALAMGALAGALLTRAFLHLIRRAINTRKARTAVGNFPATGDFAVVEDAGVHAYAVPGGTIRGRRRGRIIVSTGMLRSLSGPQRRALIAHERAHLRYHHHRYAQLAHLAAAANPLMIPVAQAVDHTIERWADAAAVDEVGDPTTVARAIGQAALARPTLPNQVLAAAGNDVIDRVSELLDPPRPRLRTGAFLAAGVALCWLSTVVVVLYTHGIIEVAEGGS